MIHYILYVILILAPIARGAVRIWAYGPIYILTLLMLIFWIFNRAKEKEIRIRRTPIDIPILLFALISIISIINSKYIYGSIMEIIKFAILALIFYIVINFITGMKQIKRTLDIILMVGSGIALFGILQYLGIIDKSWWYNPRFLSATYVNHNHFAGLMELVIPISVGMILSEKDAGKRSLYIYSFLILCVAFLLSMSRGAWFSLSLSMLFMFVIIYRKGKSRFIFCITVLLIMVLGIFVFNAIDIELLLTRVSSYRELDFSGRIEIWKGTAGLIKDNLLLGVGPGMFVHNFPKYRPLGISRLINYAHNDYLQVASEMGVLVLTIMVYIIYRVIKKGLKTHNIAKRSFKKWTSLALATGVLSLSLHALGDFNFYIPANAILFTVFCALILNVSSRREKEYPQLVFKFSHIFGKLTKPFVLMITALLIVLISTSIASEIYSTASDKAILRNDSKKAEHLLLSAQKLSPFNYKYPYKLANVYSKEFYDEKYVRKSEGKYKEALRLNPIDGWSSIGLADTYSTLLFRHSSFDHELAALAFSAYQKSIDIDPFNSYYLKKFAGFFLNLGETDLSSSMYKRASSVMANSKGLSWISRTFADGKSYEDEARLAFAAQDIRKALLFYRMSEEFGENSEAAKLDQMRCYIKMALVKEALRKYKELGYSLRNKSILFASLGGYYLEKGLIRTAERFSKRSIILDSENPEGHHLNHKISKKINKDDYSASKISKILDFNKTPTSVDLGPHNFEITFDYKERLCRGKQGLDMVLPDGIYIFHIKARGKKADDIWPHMIVKFNNRNVLNTYVNDVTWKDYQGIIVADYPVNRLDIIYDNDCYGHENTEDRDLYIDEIRLNNLQY